MTTVVFVGPSLPRVEAMSILEAVYLPPARQADILSAWRRYRPQVIALIDGVFERSPAVWHKELLFVLEQGVSVYGAASMGALRAAEMEPYGMRGVGEIYGRYAAGMLDDDEVALVHAGAELDYQPLSVPMVNLRATLEEARQRGLLEEAELARLVRLAKAQHFSLRSYRSVFEAAGLEADRRQRLLEFVRSEGIDLKRRDAIQLLETLRDVPTQPASAPPNCPRTSFFETMRSDEPLDQIPLQRLAAYVALHSPDFDRLLAQATNRALVEILGGILEVEATPDQVAEETRRFLRVNAIDDREGWLADNHLLEEEFQALMGQQAVARVLYAWLQARGHSTNHRALVDELRLTGVYPEWHRRARLQHELVSRHHPDFPVGYQPSRPLEQLLAEQLRSQQLTLPAPYPVWAGEAGFPSLDHLYVELERAERERQVVREAALRGASPC